MGRAIEAARRGFCPHQMAAISSSRARLGSQRFLLVSRKEGSEPNVPQKTSTFFSTRSSSRMVEMMEEMAHAAPTQTSTALSYQRAP